MSSKSETFLFLFGTTNRWWGKYLKGFSHVALMKCHDEDTWICVHPGFQGSNIELYEAFTLEDARRGKFYTDIVEVEILRTKKDRLLKPTFLTCVTVVQYLASISLNCFLAQTFYEKLTCKDIQYLASHGIIGVKEWVTNQ